mmetsp:Transcript_5292/g.10352  ORF Transcript_5292/g.10352 Transcript_5292/m.10352 type:complete len:80 (+) Transcript_5292:511-750(+)
MPIQERERCLMTEIPGCDSEGRNSNGRRTGADALTGASCEVKVHRLQLTNNFKDPGVQEWSCMHGRKRTDTGSRSSPRQ